MGIYLYDGLLGDGMTLEAVRPDFPSSLPNRRWPLSVFVPCDDSPPARVLALLKLWQASADLPCLPPAHVVGFLPHWVRAAGLLGATAPARSGARTDAGGAERLSDERLGNPALNPDSLPKASGFSLGLGVNHG